MNAPRLARRQWLVHAGAAFTALLTPHVVQAQTTKPAGKAGELGRCTLRATRQSVD